jgi:hypothetical protein
MSYGAVSTHINLWRSYAWIVGNAQATIQINKKQKAVLLNHRGVHWIRLCFLWTLHCIFLSNFLPLLKICVTSEMHRACHGWTCLSALYILKLCDHHQQQQTLGAKIMNVIHWTMNSRKCIYWVRIRLKTWKRKRYDIVAPTIFLFRQPLSILVVQTNI